MQASIDERREVAIKIRKGVESTENMNESEFIDWLFETVGSHFGGYEFLLMLADLIDPTPWANTVEDNGRLLDRCRELERELAEAKAGR